MAVTLDIPQRELKKAQQQLWRWQLRKREKLEALIEVYAGRIEETAKQLAPEATGDLRDSITHVLTATVREIAAEIGAEAFYAPFVELGTPNAAAQPFLRPAFERHRRDFQRDVLRILRSP